MKKKVFGPIKKKSKFFLYYQYFFLDENRCEEKPTKKSWLRFTFKMISDLLLIGNCSHLFKGKYNFQP